MASVPLLSSEGAPAGFKPLTINTETGIRRYYQDLEDGRIRIIAVQSVQEILDSNQRRAWDAKGSFVNNDSGGFGELAARVPVMLAERWDHHECGEKLDPDDAGKVWDKNLNSSEFEKLRIARFKL